uniref:Estrogen receptor binding site associated antigen 9 n=1 Tax=Salmo trutta TaxID=8032 RepID=A0A673VPF1_SALTR
MAISQFRLFKICTWLATFLSFFRRLICRSGRLRKLSGDQISLPTTVDFSSVPKQPEIEEWSSWDEEGPTSIKIEGGNGNVPPQPGEEEEPDYFKDMAPTIRKTQKIVLKKREPLNYLVPDGSAGFSSRLAATQDTSFIQPSTTEDGRERKAFHGTAEEEDGEGGSEDDEEGPEDCCQALVTFCLEHSSLEPEGKKRNTETNVITPSSSHLHTKIISTPQSGHLKQISVHQPSFEAWLGQCDVCSVTVAFSYRKALHSWDVFIRARNGNWKLAFLI